MNFSARILIVEDVTVSQIILRGFLERLGYQVELARDGEEAVIMYQNGYDLILMDNLMPKMDGYQATIEIRKLEEMSGKRVPIIALTSSSFKDVLNQLFDAGVDDIVFKPVGNILAEKVSFWLDKNNPKTPD